MTAASQAPAGPASASEVLERLARALVAELDVSACAISRVVGDLLVDIVGYARDREQLFLGYGYLISDYPVTREVLERRVPRSLTIHDAGVDDREASVLRDLGYESILMLPLTCESRVWALVEAYAAGKRRFGPRDIARAEELVREAGSDLERLGV